MFVIMMIWILWDAYNIPWPNSIGGLGLSLGVY